MISPLAPAQLRILGVLIEKQFATPEYYPLTLNALIAGCNQKSNRDPVVHLDEPEVSKALRELCMRDLAREVHDPSGRVPRYAHRINAVVGVDGAESAILCELMLRGPQTAGELRGRGSRLTKFDTLEGVEAILKALAEREEPLVVLMERQPGARERRWAQLLGGKPAQAAGPIQNDDQDESGSMPAGGSSRSASQAGDIERLEGEVAELRAQVAELSAQVAELSAQVAELSAAFERFRKQFE